MEGVVQGQAGGGGGVTEEGGQGLGERGVQEAGQVGEVGGVGPGGGRAVAVEEAAEQVLGGRPGQAGGVVIPHASSMPPGDASRTPDAHATAARATDSSPLGARDRPGEKTGAGSGPARSLDPQADRTACATVSTSSSVRAWWTGIESMSSAARSASGQRTLAYSAYAGWRCTGTG